MQRRVEAGVEAALEQVCVAANRLDQLEPPLAEPLAVLDAGTPDIEPFAHGGIGAVAGAACLGHRLARRVVQRVGCGRALQRHREVVADGAGEEVGARAGMADAPRDDALVQPGEVVTRDRDRARGRHDLARDHLGKGAPLGARARGDGDHAAGRDVDGGALQDRAAIAVAHHDVAHLDRTAQARDLGRLAMEQRLVDHPGRHEALGHHLPAQPHVLGLVVPGE
ncbi:MAG: hypothetical protein AAFZ09_14995, partial [Pseudomonadota bacterium]